MVVAEENPKIHVKWFSGSSKVLWPERYVGFFRKTDVICTQFMSRWDTTNRKSDWVRHDAAERDMNLNITPTLRYEGTDNESRHTALATLTNELAKQHETAMSRPISV